MGYRKHLNYFVLLFTAGMLSIEPQAAQLTLRSNQDVHIWTFGGGQGGNTFLKFDISPVPAGITIDSVIVEMWVWGIGANWDRDVKFWNVNSQTWTETDSARLIWAIPTSDTILQASGFATAAGWARSVNIAPIFLNDYNALRTYMSVKLKDPDDMTTVPMPGSLPINVAESLAVGNHLTGFSQHIYASPRECADTAHRPTLTIFYSTSRVRRGDLQAPTLRFALKLSEVQRGSLKFSLIVPQGERVELALLDLSGRRIVSEEVMAAQSHTSQTMTIPGNLKGSVYFLKAAIRERTVVRKVVLLD